jgi:hypothetical protein
MPCNPFLLCGLASDAEHSSHSLWQGPGPPQISCINRLQPLQIQISPSVSPQTTHASQSDPSLEQPPSSEALQAEELSAPNSTTFDEPRFGSFWFLCFIQLDRGVRGSAKERGGGELLRIGVGRLGRQHEERQRTYHTCGATVPVLRNTHESVCHRRDMRGYNHSHFRDKQRIRIPNRCLHCCCYIHCCCYCSHWRLSRDHYQNRMTIVWDRLPAHTRTQSTACTTDPGLRKPRDKCGCIRCNGIFRRPFSCSVHTAAEDSYSF